MKAENVSGGWCITRLGETASTNTLALDFAREAFLKGTGSVDRQAFVAERQLAGRGQHGRVWSSPAGGLYLSAVVERVPMELRAKLALVAGAAALLALERIGCEGGLGIRWPNDLMLGGVKVGGILCESVAVGERWAGVIGIGINVETRREEMAAEVRPFAATLRERLPDVTVAAVEEALLESLGAVLDSVNRSESCWQGVLMRLRCFDILCDRHVTLQVDGAMVAGVAAGIDDAGRLLVRTSGGVEALSHGHLVLLDGLPVRSV